MTQYKVEWKSVGGEMTYKVWDSLEEAERWVMFTRHLSARITATREVGPWVEWTEPGGEKA